MRIGIGYSNNPDARASGILAAEDALRFGAVKKPDLVLAFCSGRLDHAEFLEGIRSRIGSAPVIGGSTIGIVTNDEISYEGFPSGLAVIEFNGAGFQIASVEGLDADEAAAGRELVQKFKITENDEVLFIFYDSIRVSASSSSPPVMNASLPLLKGIESGLRSRVPIVGAGLIGDYQFRNTQQFCGSEVLTQSVVGVLLSGPFRYMCRIMHGCSPIDGIYRTITKINGSVICELDGRPIVDIIDEIYGDQNWRTQYPANLLTIGVNYGERYSCQEENYVNRLITGMLPGGGGIGLFEPDLENGMEIQFMLRDGKLMIDSAKSKAEALMQDILRDGAAPLFAFYIDCAGRAAAYSNSESEEAAEVQKVMNAYGVPLFGIYSGVEIAPVQGQSRGLDWTGVLTVFVRKKE